jgi:hypothetical protein
MRRVSCFPVCTNQTNAAAENPLYHVNFPSEAARRLHCRRLHLHRDRHRHRIPQRTCPHPALLVHLLCCNCRTLQHDACCVDHSHPVWCCPSVTGDFSRSRLHGLTAHCLLRTCDADHVGRTILVFICICLHPFSFSSSCRDVWALLIPFTGTRNG